MSKTTLLKLREISLEVKKIQISCLKSEAYSKNSREFLLVIEEIDRNLTLISNRIRINSGLQKLRNNRGLSPLLENI